MFLFLIRGIGRVCLGTVGLCSVGILIGITLDFRYFERHILKHEFMGIQETHGNEGRARALDLGVAYSCFGSHWDVRHNGIGLIIKNSFLKNFSSAVWEDIEIGRVGVLRLDGSKGSLDLWIAGSLDHSANQTRTRS